jgi:hypothetical protein
MEIEMSDQSITLSEGQLDALVAKSAHIGAKKALADLGLHDENAATDIREIRNILDGYRIAKSGFLSAFGKALAVCVLAIIGFGIYLGGGLND